MLPPLPSPTAVPFARARAIWARWGWLAHLLLAALVVALIVWGARTLDLTRVWASLRQADPLLLSTAVPSLLVACFFFRAARFHTMVRTLPAPAGGPFRFLESARTLAACQAANNLVPFRLGELVRTRDLTARDYPLGPVAVMQLSEKGVELTSLAIVALPLLPMGVLRLPLPASAGLLALAVGVVAVAIWSWRRRSREAPLLAALADRRALAKALLLCLAADSLEILLILVCLRALGLSPGWLASTAALVGLNLAIAVPSTPAQAGAFEAGPAVALALFGVDAEQAVAFALLYRAVQWFPTTLIGSACWLAPRRPAPGATAPSPER